MNNTKKVVITNVFGPLNRGDHELFKVLVNELKKYNVETHAIARDPELCEVYFPEIKFYEQLGKTDLQRSVGFLLRIFYLFVCLLVPILPFVESLLPKSQRNGVKQIKHADLVIACPGGFLEDSSLSFYAHLVQIFISVSFRRKIILAPMSIGPANSFIARFSLKFVLKRVNAVFVRELVSEKLCQDLNISCITSNDLALAGFVEPQNNDISSLSLDQKNRSNPANYIAATVINWNFPRSKDVEKSRERYVANMAHSLNLLYESTKLEIVLIVQVENDILTIKDLSAQLNAPHRILYEINTPEQIKSVLSKSYCMIASRFHSAIFALTVGCPVIALSYLPKTSGMLDMYKLPELYRDIDSFDPIEVANHLLTLAKNPTKICDTQKTLSTNIELTGNPFYNYLEHELMS